MARKPETGRQDFLTLLLQISLVVAMLATVVPLAGLSYVHVTGDNLTLPPGVFEAYQFICRSVVVWPLVALVVFMFWIYGANKKARIMSQGMEFSPGWAVGWFFVPFASLIQPYFVMTELYNASRNPTNWKSLKRPAIVGLWWGIWVVAAIAGIISRFSEMADGADPALVIAVCVSVALIIKQLMSLIICTQIAGWQKRTRQDVTVGDVF